MKKRGLSPLISWILIIAFSVAMAMLIIPAMIDNIKGNLPKSNIEYCNDVRVSLTDANSTWRTSTNNASLHVSVKNDGSFTVQKFTIGRETTTNSQQWCEYSNVSLAPGNSGELSLDIDTNYYFDVSKNSFTQCETSSSSSTETMVVGLELVPWITVEGESINCDNQRVVIKDTIGLNRII
nr:hypothetical protein [Nanoarchaeum sp.]